jgi:Spy/CpxP family protein refolding chaperone
VEADMAVARARTHAEVFQLLTPEQKTQAKTLQSNARGTDENSAGRGRGAH